jgi:eukaryotic-like serine/threonine-protein kinase
LERMELHAKKLEDRLERLSGSMPPALDPEATRVQVKPEFVAGSVPLQRVGAGKPMIVDLPSRRKRLPLVLIGVALMGLVLAGAGVGAYLYFQAPEKIKPDLVAIEGGNFMMGRANGPLQETPAHPVSVQQFMMDRTEVSNTEYADFVSETNHTAPSHWADNKPPFGQELWPVVNVSLDDANAFAAWRSKRDGVTYRLPTEQEWEYAARNGERNDLYPWGTEWKNDLAVVIAGTPAPVNSRPDGKNRWGVVDLIGNVWEWTSSTVSSYPGNPVVIPASAQDWIAIRGGCYRSDPAKPDAPVSSAMREFVPAATKTTLLGFRLVRSGAN